MPHSTLVATSISNRNGNGNNKHKSYQIAHWMLFKFFSFPRYMLKYYTLNAKYLSVMQEFEICRADVVSFRVQRTEAFSIYLPMLQFYWGVEKGEIKYSIDMHILYAYEVT